MDKTKGSSIRPHIINAQLNKIQLTARSKIKKSQSDIDD
jgi:hypothetical protein